jgi:hypothetical protein
MAKIIAEKSAFVAVGAWNPAIFRPEWLLKEFPEQIPESFLIELDGNANLRFDLGGFYLQTLNDRLVLTPKNDLNDSILETISKLSKGICERLRYTPLIAVGSNFFFELDKNEKFSSEEIEKLPNISNLPDKLQNTSLTSRSIKHTFSKDDLNISIHYEIAGNDKTMLINFERKNSIDMMARAAQSLIEDFRCALELSEVLITKGK